MNIQKCVGCGRELWWHGDSPPICKTCHSDPAPLIAKWKSETLAAREYIKFLSDNLRWGMDTDEWEGQENTYLTAKVEDAQP